MRNNSLTRNHFTDKAKYDIMRYTMSGGIGEYMEIRTSEFQIKVVGHWGSMPIVIYEATEPAEIYTIPQYAWVQIPSS